MGIRCSGLDETWIGACPTGGSWTAGVCHLLGWRRGRAPSIWGARRDRQRPSPCELGESTCVMQVVATLKIAFFRKACGN